MSWTPQIAVLIPCLNEEVAIPKVIADFRRHLPDALIFVYDNGSTDRTSDVARAAGAIVRREPLKGKGNVVRRMFADIEADIYVLVDGDDTYDAASAPALIQRLIEDSLDMVNGAREEKSDLAYRRGHRFGNRLLTGLVVYFFGERMSDMLSGYRIMSRRFVNRSRPFHRLRDGDGIDRARIGTAPADRRGRDAIPGTTARLFQQLRTIPDGIRVVRLIARLVREERRWNFSLPWRACSPSRPSCWPCR